MVNWLEKQRERWQTAWEGARRPALLAALGVFILLLGIGWLGSRLYEDWLLAGARARTSNHLRMYGTALAGSLDRRLALFQGLKSWVDAEVHDSGSVSDHEFQLVAGGLRAGATDIRALAVLPDGIIRYVYPAAGNERSFGFDPLRDDPRPDVRAALQRAIESGRLDVSEPHDLVSGGLGLVMRQAVYRDDKYWGLVNLIVNVPAFLNEGGLNAPHPELNMALRTGSGQVLYGAGAVFAQQPSTYRIALPDGYWELAGAPPGGWEESIQVPLRQFYAMWLVIAGLIALLAYLVIGREARLARAVQARTAELSLLNATLAREQDLLDALMDNIPDLIYFKDAESRFTRINKAQADTLGVASSEEALGKTDFDYFTPEHARDAFAAEQKIIEMGQPLIGRLEQIKRADGTFQWVTATKVAIKDREGRVTGTVGISRDMSEQVRAEAEREEQRQMLRTLLDALPDLILFKGRNSVYRMCNRTLCQFVGRPLEELIGKSDFDLFPLEDARRYREEEVRVLETGEPLVVEHQVKGPTGIFWEEVVKTPLRDERGEIIGVLTAGRNIAGRKRLEAELVRAKKLESVGILAGGIAHDFNNLLTAILGNISLARTEARDKGETDIEDILTTAERASLRAADLTRQLLTFAQGGAPVKKTVSIAGSLPEWVEFALRGSNVRCQFAIADDLWPVHADEGQISQVLHNLVLNARQAMPAGGVIRLAATNVTLRASLATLAPGRYVEVVLADDGTGIPEEHLPTIFDPYFTTRQKGSGLGLATAYSIIKNHQGYIEAESTLGQGATFRIYLPAAEPTGVKEQAPEDVPLTGHGRILVMDDEPAVRASAQRVLKHSGYAVEAAADGAEAVEIYRQAREAGQPFDLVVLDLTVPGGMGGLAALQKLREIDSRVKAVVSSGYSTDPVMAEAARDGFQGVIPKPYRWDQFCQVVQDVLAEDAP